MSPIIRRNSNKGKNKLKKKGQTTKFIFTVAKILIVFFVALGCTVSGVLGGAVYGYIKTAQPIKDEQLQIKILTSFIYDEKGNEIAKLTGRENMNRELVYYGEIPEYLKKAFIAIEDERFEKHPGVDLKRFLSAALNVLSAGKIGHKSGGSTITMQVVRNITQKTKVTLQRKIQEQWNALLLEKRMSKWQILELYMNIIFMGNGCYGVQSASKTYFDKEVADLSLAECAFLAGITNSPGLYDPFSEKGLENAKVRQKIILRKMLELGNIDKKQYNEALMEELKIATPGEGAKNLPVQTYFVDQVIRDVKSDLMKERGMSEEMALTTIYNYGLKIYTTQDSDIQKIVDDVFLDDKYFPEVNKKALSYLEHPQAAMVILDPWTGQVRAIYGGYGEKTASNTLNRATQTARHPGSTIKPIAVYAPAIDLGLITPADIIDDVPVYMMTTGEDKDKPYPTNYDHTYDGLTTVRNGLKASINVVAAKIWRDILGPDHSIEYLKKVGINRENEKYLSLVLGGLYEGVNPLQMSAAFAPFANKGLYYEPTTYTRVEDSDGNVLLEKRPQFHAAYSETTAFLMVDMMKDVCRYRNNAYPRGGTASSIIREDTIGMPVAGKTGTTSDNVDKWFVGYTPYYTAATWYGYDNRIKQITLIPEEYNQAQLIWRDVMKKVHEKLEQKNFEEPSGLVKARICIYSGKRAADACVNDPRGDATIEEYFVKGTEPKYDDICDVHIKTKVCKDSQDIWQRDLLAGPHCPTESVTEKVFIQRKVPFVPVKPGDKYPKDWVYELPAGEYCTVHGAPPYDTAGEVMDGLDSLDDEEEHAVPYYYDHDIDSLWP